MQQVIEWQSVDNNLNLAKVFADSSCEENAAGQNEISAVKRPIQLYTFPLTDG